MSQESEEQAIDQGHACAMAALTAQKSSIAALPPGDRLYWWFGFLTAAMGAAVASIGESAVRALRSVLTEGWETPDGALRGRYVGAAIELLKKGTYVRGTVTPVKKKA